MYIGPRDTTTDSVLTQLQALSHVYWAERHHNRFCIDPVTGPQSCILGRETTQQILYWPSYRPSVMYIGPRDTTTDSVLTQLQILSHVYWAERQHNRFCIDPVTGPQSCILGRETPQQIFLD